MPGGQLDRAIPPAFRTPVTSVVHRDRAGLFPALPQPSTTYFYRLAPKPAAVRLNLPSCTRAPAGSPRSVANRKSAVSLPLSARTCDGKFTHTVDFYPARYKFSSSPTPLEPRKGNRYRRSHRWGWPASSFTTCKFPPMRDHPFYSPGHPAGTTGKYPYFVPVSSDWRRF